MVISTDSDFSEIYYIWKETYLNSFILINQKRGNKKDEGNKKLTLMCRES